MTSTKLFTIGLITLCTGLLGCERQVSYTEDIQPLLFASCLQCHDKNLEGYATSGFSLDSYDAVMHGTKFGKVVVAGSSESSSLYLVVAHKTAPEIHMPPHHEDALAEGRGIPWTDEQIEVLKLWIDQGAPDN